MCSSSSDVDEHSERATEPLAVQESFVVKMKAVSGIVSVETDTYTLQEAKTAKT